MCVWEKVSIRNFKQEDIPKVSFYQIYTLSDLSHTIVTSMTFIN